MARHWPRFEVVRTDAGFHARYVAGNGRIVWTTEVYQRRAKAINAIGLIASGPPRLYQGQYEVAVPFHVFDSGLLEVREVDER